METKEKPLKLNLPLETIAAFRNTLEQIERINNMTAETADAIRTNFAPVVDKLAEINHTAQNVTETIEKIIQMFRESLNNVVHGVEPIREFALKWQETIEHIERVNPDFFERPVPESLFRQVKDASSYIKNEIIVDDEDDGNNDDSRPIIHYHIHVEQTKNWGNFLMHLWAIIQIALTLYALAQGDPQFDTLMSKLDEIRTSIEQQINADQ